MCVLQDVIKVPAVEKLKYKMLLICIMVTNEVCMVFSIQTLLPCAFCSMLHDYLPMYNVHYIDGWGFRLQVFPINPN